MLTVKRKLFSEYQKGVTKYDRTDAFKAMKDSDILAEKKRSNTGSYVRAGKHAVSGAAIGGILGNIGGAALGARRGGVKAAIKGAKLGALTGAAVGGTIGTATGLARGHKEREQNRFVNRRLKEAQKQALRRESKDWKSNIVGRSGYNSIGGGRSVSSSAPSYDMD